MAPTPPRLWHDINEANHPLYCSQPTCREQRAPLLFGGQKVGLELMTSDDKFIRFANGSVHQFTEGYIECSACGARYYPQSVWDPAE